MSDVTDHDSIRFYFSFRSPYAWLAAERLDSELADLVVPIDRIPIFPTPETFPNDPSAVPNKERYIGQDIARLAREQGLKVRFPSSLERHPGRSSRSGWSPHHVARHPIRSAPGSAAREVA